MIRHISTKKRFPTKGSAQHPTTVSFKPVDTTYYAWGGAVSIDRTDRIKHDAKHPDSSVVSYWENEMPFFNEEALNDIGQNFKIDTVVTHTSPTFCELISKAGLSEWAARDSNLLADCDSERRAMDHIFEYLKANNHPLEHWFYGHFHQNWSSSIDGVLFSMLDIMEFKELR